MKLIAAHLLLCLVPCFLHAELLRGSRRITFLRADDDDDELRAKVWDDSIENNINIEQWDGGELEVGGGSTCL